jgi:hypothetical protein
MRKNYKWTDKEISYLREIANGKYISEIVELMSKKFNYTFRETQIKSTMIKYKIKNNMKNKVPKGLTPWNKGIQIGNSHIHNLKSIGDEYISSEGFIMMKLDNPTRWVHKHRYLYEQTFGEIPKDKVLIFLDGNKQNLNLDNLKCITRKQLIKMNQNKLFFNNAELTEAGSELANLMLRINEVSKNKK